MKWIKQNRPPCCFTLNVNVRLRSHFWIQVATLGFNKMQRYAAFSAKTSFLHIWYCSICNVICFLFVFFGVNTQCSLIGLNLIQQLEYMVIGLLIICSSRLFMMCHSSMLQGLIDYYVCSLTVYSDSWILERKLLHSSWLLCLHWGMWFSLFNECWGEDLQTLVSRGILEFPWKQGGG